MKKLFFKDITLPIFIGIYDHERQTPQNVIINATLDMQDSPPSHDHINHVLNYDDMMVGIKNIALQEHIDLQETLAYRILDFCLSFEEIIHAEISVCKPDAYDDCAAVGFIVSRGQ